MDVAIIGGGAAGMCLAVAAARENPDAKIEVIEKNKELGKKILATGNGRCNISNRNASGLNPVLDFFESIGLMLREENEGRLYPYSEQAGAVVAALEREMDRLGIQKRTLSEVEKIEKAGSGFRIHLKNGETLSSKKVAITTGGKAAPQYGTTGDGYSFARGFGHRIVRLVPTLMPLVCEGNFETIKGVRAKGRVTLLKEGVPVCIETGEIQFTEEGLSGICIFNLSRLLKIEEGMNLDEGFRKYTISIDFVPEKTPEALLRHLRERKKRDADQPAAALLHSIINSKLEPFVCESILGKRKTTAGGITEEELKKLAEGIKAFELRVTGGKGWKFAQCTGGGVSMDEINMDTLESTLVKGLFFGGEIIDYDGPCGGYNLQNAWANGLVAGCNIVKGI